MTLKMNRWPQRVLYSIVPTHFSCFGLKREILKVDFETIHKHIDLSVRVILGENLKGEETKTTPDIHVPDKKPFSTLQQRTTGAIPAFRQK